MAYRVRGPASGHHSQQRQRLLVLRQGTNVSHSNLTLNGSHKFALITGLIKGIVVQFRNCDRGEIVLKEEPRRLFHVTDGWNLLLTVFTLDRWHFGRRNLLANVLDRRNVRGLLKRRSARQ